MTSVLENLKLLNSKERFFLVSYAFDNADFVVSSAFRQQLSSVLAITVPADAFAAMDYHLDWLFAAIQKATQPSVQVFDNKRGFIKGNQEDIDFLLAYQQRGTTHVILLEAKGVTGWKNEQMNSKAQRLRDFFGDEGMNQPGIAPHFAIVSPKKSQGLKPDTWPKWMRTRESYAWIELPSTTGHFGVQRCNADGKKSKFGKSWKLAPR